MENRGSVSGRESKGGQWSKRRWVRNKSSLKAGDGNKVGLNRCIFWMNIALTSFDCGCSASRQNEIASTGLMTFPGQLSLFLKVQVGA